MTVKFQLSGKSRINVQRFPQEFEDALEPAFEKIILRAEARSKEHYFKSGGAVDANILTARSGTLRRIITSEVKKQQTKVYASLIADIEYAATNEYGDPMRNISARPFLEPAITDVIEDLAFEEIIFDEINKRTEW